MAEGLINHDLGDSYIAYSAGTEATHVKPLAIKVMNEIGIDISHHHSKTLNTFAELSFDYVISLCDDADKKCPLFFGGIQRVHLGFDDPSQIKGPEEEVLPEYRRVRDEIRQRLKQFLTGQCS
jgi:arsenate reductase